MVNENFIFKKSGFFLFFLFVNVFVPTLSNAQNTLSSSDILASAKQQYVLELQQQRVDYLKNSTYKLPLVDEMEFRTETNDFRLKEQQYVLRGRFHTKAQQQAQADFQQAKIELNTIEEQLLMQDLLRERYDAIVKVSYFEKLLAAKKDQKILLEDRMTVLKRSINLPKFDILDLIDAEDDLHEADREILRLRNALNLAQQKIFRFSNQRGYLKTDELQLIEMGEVMKVVRSLSTEPSAAHATLVKRNLNVNLAATEQAIRRTQEENTLDYLQAQIGGTDDDGFRQNFSLGMGITIPVRNRQQQKLDELEFEQIDESLKYEEIKIELKERMTQIRLEMENQYELYQLLNQQLENSQADQVLKQYQKIAGASPIAMLKLKGSQFKKELEQFSVQQNIYVLYVELLDASGKMMELPLRNYLMRSLEEF
ncbi:MAG: hypothetical protein ACJAT4_001796 [Granulosicoccus sp.]|jgi:hypothetical protein